VPLYEYECDACGRRFEVIQKYSDQSVEVCKECGKGPVRRLLSSPAIQFKGSGFYINDYAQKGKSDSKSDSSSTPAGKTGDTAKSETSSDSGAAKSDTAKTPTPATAPKSKDS
jgi:putative FmdB family regulatory protein